MSRVTQDDAAEAVVGVVASAIGGMVLLGAAAVNAVLERRRQNQLVDEEVARLLIEDYLNRPPGVALGDSGVSFRYQDPVIPAEEEDEESFLNRLFGSS